MPSQKKGVDDEVVFDALVREASGFYKLILTISSSFLGGTLLFLEKIAPSPPLYSVFFLGAGWVFLTASLAALVWVRRQNLQSGFHRLEGEMGKAKEVDKSTRWWSTAAFMLMVLGVAAIMVFGGINLVQRARGKDGNNVSSVEESQAAVETLDPLRKHRP